MKHLIAAASLLALTGCGTAAEPQEKAKTEPIIKPLHEDWARDNITESTVVLSNGMKVKCLVMMTQNGNGGLSCDWHGAGKR